MKYAIATLGCKVNQFESQAMEALLEERGHSRTQSGDADAVIVNTCAVTAESGRKSRQALRRLQKENPGAVSGVCGCFSQISPEEAAALGADVVFGSGDRRAFVAALEHAVEQAAEQTAEQSAEQPAEQPVEQRGRSEARPGQFWIDNPFHRRTFEPLPAGALEGRTRAYLKIEDGCDNFCAYCVIPYARGRVRSLPIASAAAEAAALQRAGFREIVVTGIEIASYGKDLLTERPGLGAALDAIARAAPETRIRLGSLEPTVITPGFCETLFACGNICPQFHLSLQSGSDRVLRAMGRRYDTARFTAAVSELRRWFPGCALTADLITGFPGEGAEEFQETLEFIRRVGFSAMHIFPYSPRPGVPAASLPGQLSKAEKEARAAAARAVAAETRNAYLHAQVGKTLPVLFETETAGAWRGHSHTYCLVQAPAAPGAQLHGVLADVRITAVDGTMLTGVIQDNRPDGSPLRPVGNLLHPDIPKGV